MLHWRKLQEVAGIRQCKGIVGYMKQVPQVLFSPGQISKRGG